MKYLMIENDGILEFVGMRVMGASSKREDPEKIGTFGTGGKYGSATVVRFAGPFWIFLGDRHVKVGTTPISLRGEEHQEVTIDGQPAGFTTGLGKDWEPWMAIREFISNALDEGGMRVGVVEERDSNPGKTRVFIPLVEEFEAAWQQRGKYFRIDELPLAHVPGGRLLSKCDPGKVCLYKKGIFIQEREGDAKFDYDFDDIQLGEDRRPRGDVREAVWTLLSKAPVDIKQEVLLSTFEASCYSYGSVDPSWKVAFGDKMVVTESTDDPGAVLVLIPFEHVATACGARTKDNDLAMKAVDRQTMPADGRVVRAARRLHKLGIAVNPQLVLLAVIPGPYVVDRGLTYLNKELDEDGMFCALACIATTKGWAGSPDHLMNLAKLLLK